MIKEERLEKHYQSVVDDYDSLYSFTDDYYDWLIGKISEYLELESNDRLVDLGGGTGYFANKIYENKKLKNDVLCVEPSAAMLEKAKRLNGVIAHESDALSFGSEQNRNYNKMFLLGVIHHLEDRVEIWRRFYNQLPNGGKILIITRPSNTTLPFFKEASESFAKSQYPLQEFSSEAESVGFSTELIQDSQIIKMPKIKWFTMLRKRFMSNLADFSEEEMEDGIKELEKKFQGKEIIDVVDTIAFIQLSKKGR